VLLLLEEEAYNWSRDVLTISKFNLIEKKDAQKQRAFRESRRIFFCFLIFFANENQGKRHQKKLFENCLGFQNVVFLRADRV